MKKYFKKRVFKTSLSLALVACLLLNQANVLPLVVYAVGLENSTQENVIEDDLFQEETTHGESAQESTQENVIEDDLFQEETTHGESAQENVIEDDLFQARECNRR